MSPIRWQSTQMKSNFSGRPMDKGATDDTRKTATPDSSMMGRPDQQLQPVKVRMRKTRPERNRKDEIWDNLVLSKLNSQHYCSDTGHHASLRNRQNWWEPLPTTVRSIRPNNTVSKTVIGVTFETVDLHEERRLFRGCAIKALIYEEGNYSELPFIFP